MHTPYIRNKFYLYGSKIILLLILFFAVNTNLQAQIRYVKKNNPNYDSRKLSYGFLIGLHTTAYQIKYSGKFVTPGFDSVYAVVPEWSPGFSLGAIINYKLADFLDFRLTPEFAFYEHRLRYMYTNETSKLQLVETVMVELPILFKYKSERRGNVRMYMIGGVKPGFEASGKRQIENSSSAGIEVKGTNISLEAGFGFDLYYPLFKFSPEIRFSRGMVNLLDNTNNIYGQPLSRINTNTITVYLLFQ